MIPKQIFTKVKQYVIKLKKEHESETMGKTGLAAVPLEVGRQVIAFITDQRAPGVGGRISREEAEKCCEYLVKQGLLAKHPWGGYMVPQSPGTPAVPPVEDAKQQIQDVLKRLGAGDDQMAKGGLDEAYENH